MKSVNISIERRRLSLCICFLIFICINIREDKQTFWTLKKNLLVFWVISELILSVCVHSVVLWTTLDHDITLIAHHTVTLSTAPESITTIDNGAAIAETYVSDFWVFIRLLKDFIRYISSSEGKFCNLEDLKAWDRSTVSKV